MFFQGMDPTRSRPQTSRSGDTRPQGQQIQISTQSRRQSIRRRSFEVSVSEGNRRSGNSTPRLSDEMRNSDNHFPDDFSPHCDHLQQQEGSEPGSVASSPVLKQHPREQRDPQNTTPRSISNIKHYRDKSPSLTRKPQTDVTNVTKMLVEELDMASESKSPHERRITAITKACDEFDHVDENRHNTELEQGAAMVLSRIITTSDDEDELLMVCTALEMVFRAESAYVHAAFRTCDSALLPTLMRILERVEAGTLKHADAIMMSISRVLLYLSRVSNLRRNLAQQQGMIDFIQQVNKPFMNSECRVMRLRIAVNLINCDENKSFLCESPGFLDTLLFVAHSDTTNLARDYAGLALMDLAASPANQIPMSNNDKLIGTLVKIILVEEMASLRESAITALQNLAFATENRVRLVIYKDGILLEALRKALSGDANDKARRRASGALTNLACHETAEVMGNHKGLLDTLAIVSVKDTNSEVQSRAVMALTKLAANITLDMPCYQILLNALVVASLSQASSSVPAALRIKARDPENRTAMARHPGVLDTLADICILASSGVNEKDNAMRAILHLTNESNNRKVMCNKKILEALVKGASMDGANTEGIRDWAIRALERLATACSNRAYMARYEGLLVAVAQATEREAKLEEGGPNPSQTFLAKPLLMSLLLAM